MQELAKWVWIILITIFFIGPWVFVYIGLIALVYFLLLWLKPEWIDKFWS